MILLAALLATGSVADAERAFAEQARSGGQWSAFRANAAPHAMMFAPQLTDAGRLLANKPDPEMAISWRPAHTITSCDGRAAYSTGPWSGHGGQGSFGTIWVQTAAGWRWLLDDGHDKGASGPDTGTVIEDRAACPAPISTSIAPPDDSVPDASAAARRGEFGGVGFSTPAQVVRMKALALADLIEASDGPMPVAISLGAIEYEGGSPDRTLLWRVNVVMNAKPGAHLLRLWSWDGRRYRLAVFDVTGTDK